MTRISDLTVEQLTTLITDIIDQRLEEWLQTDGELREDFVEELEDQADIEEAKKVLEEYRRTGEGITLEEYKAKCGL
ncbi:MAG: hypothetical protein P9X24_13320 [Candidatus Hatepunaea meridiana]|nr:hypothetical protein [Candidatus Hatepunaea meridiana]